MRKTLITTTMCTQLVPMPLVSANVDTVMPVPRTNYEYRPEPEPRDKNNDVTGFYRRKNRRGHGLG
jgi:hypothetical protein